MNNPNVDIWRTSTLQPDPVMSVLHATLSPDEQQRAARFRFEKHRRANIVSRGMLRQLLSRYTSLPAEKIQFAYNAHGKPSLAIESLVGSEGSAARQIRFNVSHSGEVVVCAVTRGREVGIDVEVHRPLPRIMSMAERFFSPLEHATLQGLPAGQRHAAFFRCWSRKEAYIKAIGRGLNMPLDRFSVSLDEQPTAALLAHLDDDNELNRWSLIQLNVNRNYGGALFIEGAGCVPRYFDWSLDARSV